VSAAPTANSFQGLPPDTTGMVLQVLWSDQTLTWVEAKDFATQGFYAVPPYCDIPTGDTVNKFMIAHNASTTVSGEFDLPAVIPADYLHVTIKGGSLDWYADEGVDPSKFELQGYYKWKEDKDGKYYPTSDSTPGLIDKTAQKTIPVSVGYPKFDLSNVATDKTVEVSVGNAGGATPKTANFSIDNYYVVTGVEFDKGTNLANVPANFFGFDDDIDYADINLSAKAQAAMLKLLFDTNPSFLISYNDGKAPKKIYFKQFYSNVVNNLIRLGEDPATKLPGWLFEGDVGLEKDQNGDPNDDVLFVNQDNDDAAWVFYMRYIPKDYGTSGAFTPATGTTYTARFPVSLPVYTFNNTIKVTRKATTNVMLYWQSTQVTLTGDEIDAINDAWTLTASYQRKGTAKTRDVPFDAAMFTKGGASGLGANLKGSAVMSGKIAGLATSGQVAIDTGWTLPLIYRAEVATDDDTVEVDLIYKNP